MMRFDRRGGAADGDRLDHIGIKGSLYQETYLAQRLRQPASLLGEYLDEFGANPLPFGFRVGNALQFRQELIRGIYSQDFKAYAFFKQFDGLLKFAVPKQSGIDEDVGQAIADGSVHQRRRHRGIDASAQSAEGPFAANLFP